MIEEQKFDLYTERPTEMYTMFFNLHNNEFFSLTVYNNIHS